MAYSVAVQTARNVTMQLIKPVVLSFIIALFASACGQKGPLFLPQSDQAPEQTRDSQATGSQEKEDSKADEKDS